MNDLANPRWNAAGLEQQAAIAQAPDLTHELGNMVQVVSGYLELLATRTEDELSLRYIATAQTAARQISELNLDLERRARTGKPQLPPG